ncbi:hypothetical protein [uncultured Chryseobacterium sp.]|uniref:hypothetical protein n=1 Tax=uncultured Chryseobacterium sp. TaxID=259322 RepID=UPI0025D1859C|nr:hypothetical protein [uncultured Chryseobacterium sp.]
MLKLVKCGLAGLTARLGGIFCAEKRVIGMVLMERSIRLDPVLLTKTAFNEFVQQDRVIGTIKFHNVENAKVDRTFTTLTNHKDIPATAGLQKWTATFYKGGRYQNQLNKLDGSERYAAVFVYEDGTILVKQLKDGTVKGFDVTLYNGLKDIQIAADAVGATLMIHLEPYEMKAWQGSAAEYASDDIDFAEMEPIAEVDMVVPVLSAGATSTVIKITQGGTDAPMIGLDNKLNWKMYRNGVAEGITNLTQVGENYTFTHAALVANDSIVFKTEMAGYPIYVLGSGYYVGKSAAKTVV